MKSRQSPPLIDPSVVYLGGFVLFVGAMILIGNLFLVHPASTAAPVHHRDFPMEADLTGAIRPGQTEDEVIAQFGSPSERGPIQDGMEVLDYFLPSSKEPENDKTVYAGFAVYLKDGKVVDVMPIRGSDLRN